MEKVISAIKYRSDIDVLRAFSIISVLLFHLDFPIARGGYLGVDIFFVISGYLITSIILKNHIDLLFIKNFLISRAKRILPAYFFVLFIVFIIGNYLFSSDLSQRFNGSVIYGIFFVSNLFFAQEGGYFAISNNLKPLLHFWSLSVEIHFYIFWIVFSFVVISLFKKLYFILIIIIFLISLFIAQYSIDFGKLNAVFLLTPFRLFEFCAGALLCNKFLKINNTLVSNIINVLGWIILSACIYSIFDKEIKHPSLITLLPLIGVSFIIVSNSSFFEKKNLINKTLIFIGKISYSLYLVHWPIIIFVKYNFSGQIHYTLKFFLICISVLISYLMYKLIEIPFRAKKYKISIKIITILTVPTLTLIVFISSVLWAKGEFFWRYKILKYNIDEITRMNDHIEDVRTLNSFRSLRNFNENAKYKILVLGDSHHEDVGSALMIQTNNRKDYSIVGYPFDDMCYVDYDSRKSYLLKIFDKWNDNCKKNKNYIISQNWLPNATHVILVNHWENYTVDLIDQAKKFIENNSNAKIIIVGQTPIFDSFDNFFYEGISKSESQFNSFFFQSKKKEWTLINERIKNVSQNLKIPYIDRYNYICDNINQSCKILFGKDFTYKDRGHWSYFGKNYFSEYIFEQVKNNL